MIEELNKIVAPHVKERTQRDVRVEWTVPEQKFGDLATNIAMVSAKQMGVNPREFAQELIDATRLADLPSIKTIEIAGPGFINVTFEDGVFLNEIHKIQHAGEAYGAPTAYKGKTVVTEFSDPNPFKALHVGHLYTSIMGDAISRMISFSGGNVVRVNFGGDVGLHVAKSMWAIKNKLGGFDVDKLQQVPEPERSAWLSERYVEGNAAYEEDQSAKEEIIVLNKQIYQLHIDREDTDLEHVYWEARAWSYEYFGAFYDRLDVQFDAYMPESDNAQLGADTVREHIDDGVYEEDNGVVLFRGEKHGLHTRVFINSEGLPTYEAKDVGVAVAKWNRYNFDESIIITGNEISEYMKVVKKSMQSYLPEAVERTRHLTHGHVRIKGSGKMSSRLGNVLTADEVLEATKQLIEQAEDDHQRELIMLGAIRYSFLRQRMGDDVQFDLSESVKTVGNSGPYLQYALVRAKSIMRSLDVVPPANNSLQPAERNLARKLSHFVKVVEDATYSLEPHLICTYLYELGQEFNKFYETCQIKDDPREAVRSNILNAYVTVLENGFQVLGIPVLERM